MKIQTTEIYQMLENNKGTRLQLYQGSARSGKTYNILIWLVLYLLQTPDKTLSIVRKTLPALKGSVLRDLKEIMETLEIYNPSKWKKQEGYYELDNGSIIEWFSTDEEQKLRGRKRDILFINEGNELERDEYVQLAIRTTGQIIIDYNPSDLYSYIYDLIEEDGTFFHKSTYKQNPFLTEQVIKEIESLKDKDPNLWRVFGLGERGVATNTIFSHWTEIDWFPTEGEVYRGLDIGYSDPMALVEVRRIEDNIYMRELIYQRGMTTPDLIYKIRTLGFDLTDNLWVDSAAPQVIEELKRAGINAKPVQKHTILHGIDMIKRHRVHIHNESRNMLDEFQNYKWKTNKDGKIIDVPEDINNHSIDAARYALEMSNKPKTQYSFL